MVDLKIKKYDLSRRKQLCLLILKNYSFSSQVPIINQLTLLTNKVFDHYKNLKDNCGIRGLVPHIKTLRLVTFRYMSGKPLFGERLKVTSKGCPLILRDALEPIMEKYLLNDKQSKESFKKLTQLHNEVNNHIRRYSPTWVLEKSKRNFQNFHMIEAFTLSLEDEFQLKYITTLLCIFRDYSAPPTLDRLPIESKWKGSLPSEVDDKCLHLQICSWIGVMTLKSKHCPKFEGYHLSNKMGPNGPALMTCMKELNVLPVKTKDNIRSLGGSLLASYMDRAEVMLLAYPFRATLMERLLPMKKQTQLPLVRKLSSFSDKEGKTRTVGIFDYWSQTCLRPIHDRLTRYLRAIPQDCTYNQGAFTQFLIDKKQSIYHSLDLTNATDRMPITLQMKVLEPILGPELTECWRLVLVDLPFCITRKTNKGRKKILKAEFVNRTDEHDPMKGCSYNPFLLPFSGIGPPVKEEDWQCNSEDSIYYRTGQPMGAYSLWPAMALTHHYIVKLAGSRASKPNFDNYVILGDDIVIADTEVAHAYRQLLFELDMPISEPKTHSSEYFFEFAKRYFYRGSEISPFGVSSLPTVYHRYYLLHNFLENQTMKGWSLTDERAPHFIRGLYKIMNKYSQGVRVVRLYFLFDLVTEFKREGHISTHRLKRVLDIFPTLSLCINTLPVLKAYLEESIKKAKEEQIRDEMSLCRSEMDSLVDKMTRLIMRHVPEDEWEIPINIYEDWHPFGSLMVRHTQQALTEFVKEYAQDLEVTQLMSFQGIVGRIMRKDLLVYKDNNVLSLVADAKLVKTLVFACTRGHPNLVNIKWDYRESDEDHNHVFQGTNEQSIDLDHRVSKPLREKHEKELPWVRWIQFA